MTFIVPELTLIIASSTQFGKLLSISFDEFTDNVSIAINNLSGFVALQAFKDREWWKIVASLFSGFTFTCEKTYSVGAGTAGCPPTAADGCIGEYWILRSRNV